MGDSRLAIIVLLGSAAATGVVYAAVRPTPPERMKAYGGPIGVLGRWAYFVTRPLLRTATALRLTANTVTALSSMTAETGRTFHAHEA